MAKPRYVLVIGDKNYSSWSLRPWIAMKRLGLSFSEISVRLRQSETKSRILEHSPSGKVPALKIGKRVIWDSLAIIEYIADVHGGLWPAERDARAMARAASAEMHAGFQALRDQCPMEVLARTPNPPLTETARNDIRRIVRSWREVRGGHGADGPFLFGPFTAADAMYAPVVFRFRTYVPDLAPYGDDGTAKAYVEAMLGTPEMMAWEVGARAEVASR